MQCGFPQGPKGSSFGGRFEAFERLVCLPSPGRVARLGSVPACYARGILLRKPVVTACPGSGSEDPQVALPVQHLLADVANGVRNPSWFVQRYLLSCRGVTLVPIVLTFSHNEGLPEMWAPLVFCKREVVFCLMCVIKDMDRPVCLRSSFPFCGTVSCL